MSPEELRERRDGLSLSVRELAHVLDVPPSNVYRWESGVVPLRGLTAVGVDAILTRLERRRGKERER